MSHFEIIITVLACAVPIVALLFVVPKIKKKEKKVPVQTKSYEDMKKEEQSESKPEIKSEPPKEKQIQTFSKNDFSPEDFRGYLERKGKNITKPSRVELPADFKDRTEPYLPRRRRREQEKPKTVAEEIRSLSSELKALIFTGALDKKDFDCD